MPAEQLDALHAAGDPQLDRHLDWSRATRPGRAVQRVNVDFPVDLLGAIDQEANRIGVPRQSWIKVTLANVIAAKLPSTP